MKLFLGLFIIAALTGCATTARQTEKFFKTSTQLPPKKLIEDVPFINQEAGQCGPATLTMAFNWARHPVKVEDVLPQVFNPKMKGTLQADMISASRRNGLIAIPIAGIDSLLAELAAGNPVIVFENLAFSWLPQWHYAIVFGYDLSRKEVIMHSGPEANKRWDMEKFERSWMLGEYWGLVVLPSSKLSATADEVAHVKAASTIEVGPFSQAAQENYQLILKRWPESLGALIGLANLAYEKKDFKNAISHLVKATEFHPNSAFAWHNLAVAQGNARMKKQANRSAQRAMALVSPDNHQTFSENLSEWL